MGNRMAYCSRSLLLRRAPLSAWGQVPPLCACCKLNEFLGLKVRVLLIGI